MTDNGGRSPSRGTTARRWHRAQKLEAKTRSTMTCYDTAEREGIAQEVDKSRAYRQRLVEERLGINLADFREMCVLEIGGLEFADRHLFGTKARYKLILDPMPWPRVSHDAEFLQAMGERIPIRSSVINVCWASNVIDHCKAPQLVLQEIARVLTENGRLYITCNVWPLWLSPFFFMLDRIDGCHPHHLTKSSFLSLLSESGFVPDIDFGVLVPRAWVKKLSIRLKVMLSRLCGERTIQFRCSISA